MTWYRLVFINGHKTAWTQDKEQIEEDAKLFGWKVKIEKMELGG